MLGQDLDKAETPRRSARQPTMKPPVRFDVCRCLGGAILSASKIASIIGSGGRSFGRSGALVRNRIPTQSENPRRFAPALPLNENQIIEPLRKSPPQTSPAADIKSAGVLHLASELRVPQRAKHPLDRSEPLENRRFLRFCPFAFGE